VETEREREREREKAKEGDKKAVAFKVPRQRPFVLLVKVC
jgi:hypothetical protein